MNRQVSMVTTIVLAVALMGLIAVNSSVAYGQAISGSLVGTVIDSSSAVVSNASVEAIKIDTGVATTTKTGGSGLGLAIANRAIEAHRGVILVDTDERGTRFIVLLPRADTNDGASP